MIGRDVGGGCDVVERERLRNRFSHEQCILLADMAQILHHLLGNLGADLGTRGATQLSAQSTGTNDCQRRTLAKTEGTSHAKTVQAEQDLPDVELHVS